MSYQMKESPLDNINNVIMNYELLLCILAYLNAKDLKSMKLINKCFYYEKSHMFNIAFKSLCLLRWNENEDRLLKIVGADSWIDAYNIMIWKKRIPKGDSYKY